MMKCKDKLLLKIWVRNIIEDLALSNNENSEAFVNALAKQQIKKEWFFKAISSSIIKNRNDMLDLHQLTDDEDQIIYKMLSNKEKLYTALDEIIYELYPLASHRGILKA